jgi:hypothetical protein
MTGWIEEETRMHFTTRRLGWIACLLIASAPASAEDHSILGRSLVVRSGGGEPSRSVVVVARESASDIGSLGNPTAAGATLRVDVQGGTGASQTFSLPAAGWFPIASGYKYRPAAGATAPVALVVLKRKSSGVALLRVKLAGTVGSDDLEIAPPAPGDSGVVELEISGGDRYCVGLGGVAGGKEPSDTATLWRVVKATSEAPCSPVPTPEPFCGNGVIESGEACDGDALGECAGCQMSVFPCSCCVPAGSEYFDPNQLRELGCCDFEGFPIAPSQTYCGSCLPDGYPNLAGAPPACGNCCSGNCYAHPSIPDVSICGTPPPTPTPNGGGTCCGCGCTPPYYLNCPSSAHQCSVPAPGATDESECDAYDIPGQLDCEFFVTCDSDNGGIPFPYCTGLPG